MEAAPSIVPDFDVSYDVPDANFDKKTIVFCEYRL